MDCLSTPTPPCCQDFDLTRPYWYCWFSFFFTFLNTPEQWDNVSICINERLICMVKYDIGYLPLNWVCVGWLQQVFKSAHPPWSSHWFSHKNKENTTLDVVPHLSKVICSTALFMSQQVWSHCKMVSTYTSFYLSNIPSTHKLLRSFWGAVVAYRTSWIQD